MKVVLLIFLMFTLALGLKFKLKIKFKTKSNKKPAQPTENKDPHETFQKRHILQKDFDRNSTDQWKEYLEENNLCKRPRQTFMEKEDQGQMEQICQGRGWLFKSDNNLCISGSPINVYDLRVNTRKCKINTLDPGQKYVVVACVTINNVCRPVYFKASKDTDEDKTDQKCSTHA